MSLTKVWSILRRATCKCFKYVREEYPVPKSSNAKFTPSFRHESMTKEDLERSSNALVSSISNSS
jgi:hypothetical protein